MTQLSAHFSLAELSVSANARRLGLDNTPPPAIQQRLIQVAKQMERVRTRLGDHPITITSAYRSPAVNRSANGAKTSAHLEGWAVDFICPGFGTPLAIAESLGASDLTYDQLIHEFGSWVHLSFDPRRRMQQLTIDGQGTRLGLWTIRP